jgi:poly(A) polymerase
MTTFETIASNLNNYEVIKLVQEFCKENNNKALVVGGAIRDSLLAIETNDIDIVIQGDWQKLAEYICDKLQINNLVFFKRFLAAHFIYKGIEWEITSARKESYNQDSRNPEVQPTSLHYDFLRRDFTINAIALEIYPEFGKLWDPFHGYEDLQKRIIRTPNDPNITFSDDPLRMLRAIRFASKLNFKIEQNTWQGIKDNKERISIIAPERIAEELNKMILLPTPSIAFYLLDDSGLLDIILPELTSLKTVDADQDFSHKDNFKHTLQVLDNICQKLEKIPDHSNNLWLRWAALLHDIGKAKTKRYDEKTGFSFHNHEVVGAKMVPAIFKRLHLPLNEKMDYVVKLVQLHLRPIALVDDIVTDSAIRRLMIDAGEYLDDLILLCECDITSKNPTKVQKFKENLKKLKQKFEEIDEKDRLRNFQPPISGEVIMQTFGLEPSKIVGEIKTSIREAIIDGEIPNDYDAAYKFMIEYGKKLGLKPKN